LPDVCKVANSLPCSVSHQNWVNASHSDGSDVAMNKNPGRVQSQSEVPESLHAAVELRVEGMTYSIQNCSELLRRVDATGAPLLRDLDVAVASSYTSSLFQKDSSERNAANLNRIEQWRTWFVTNCVPAEDAISNVRNLSLSGYIYSGSDSECSTYDLVRPLLRRMPRLSRLDLFIGSLLDLPRPEVDFQSALPVFNELEELTIAQSSLGFLQDRLEKMGSTSGKRVFSKWHQPRALAV